MKIPLLLLLPIAAAMALGADQAVDRFLEGLNQAYAEMGKKVGLDDNQKAKLAEIEKAFADRLKQDPAAARDPGLQQEAIARFESILTPEQGKTYQKMRTDQRAQVERIHSGANLSQIGRAALLHANANRGLLPKDLGALARAGDLQGDQFICRTSRKTLPKDWADQSEKQQIDWINQNTDYAYTGAGRNLHKDPTFVIAHEKPEVAAGGCNFLLSDGSVHLEPGDRAARIIEELKKGKNPPETAVGGK